MSWPRAHFLVQNGYTAVPLEGTGLDQTFECYSHDGDSALPEYLAHRLEKLAAEAEVERGEDLFVKGGSQSLRQGTGITLSGTESVPVSV